MQDRGTVAANVAMMQQNLQYQNPNGSMQNVVMQSQSKQPPSKSGRKKKTLSHQLRRNQTDLAEGQPTTGLEPKMSINLH